MGKSRQSIEFSQLFLLHFEGMQLWVVYSEDLNLSEYRKDEGRQHHESESGGPIDRRTRSTRALALLFMP